MPGQPWTALAPLINFTKSPSGSIEVLPHVKIRGLTIEDQGADDSTSMFRFLSQQTSWLISNLPRSWVLVEEFEQPREAAVLQTQAAHEDFSSVVNALHLLHDEMVEFPFTMFGAGQPPVWAMGEHGAPFPPIQAWNRANNRPYSLTADDMEPLRELTDLLVQRLKAEPDGATAIGMGRINATHLRVTDADRIIDSAIALEAILLKGSEDELSYRQAIRGAHLLGGSTATREENFRLLRKAYDRRSKIVHGMRDPGSPSTEAIVSITRRIVQAFVFETRGTAHDALIERLDRSAVGGSES